MGDTDHVAPALKYITITDPNMAQTSMVQPETDRYVEIWSWYLCSMSVLQMEHLPLSQPY